jgi:hypothetical protein
MADTLQNINLPINTWVDIYAATGITVGTAISVQNIGVSDVYLTVLTGEPPIDYDAYNIVQRDNGVRLRNDSGDSGAWAMCPNNKGKINVRPV